MVAGFVYFVDQRWSCAFYTDRIDAVAGGAGDLKDTLADCGITVYSNAILTLWPILRRWYPHLVTWGGWMTSQI